MSDLDHEAGSVSDADEHGDSGDDDAIHKKPTSMEDENKEKQPKSEEVNEPAAFSRSSSSVTLSPIDLKKENIRTMKNILLISVAFLFNFNAFQGLSRLQSSLHRVEGMGVITSSVLYGSLVLSCMFVPKLLIYAIGHRWTIAMSFSGYILWMAANGYAVWGTMITASILVGLCAAPLWTAQCSYFTIIAGQYAKNNGENEEAVVTRFFGIFFMFFQLSSITGSIISSTVLKPPEPDANETIDIDYGRCGHNDCPWFNVSQVEAKPDSTTVWTMVGIYIGIACLAVVVVALFVDNLPANLVEKRVNVKEEIMSSLVASFKQMPKINQIFIIPLTMYSGFEQASFSAEWTRSFITCGFGIWKVGLVTLAFGVVNATVSFTSGYIVKYTGRIPVFLAGMCVDLGIQFTMMFWLPSADQEYVLYILSGLWGFTDGIWQTQINAFYGCLFPTESEAAFANYRLWESVGFIIAFAYSNFICTNAKIYVLTSVLFVGMAGYAVVEWRFRKEEREKRTKVHSELSPVTNKTADQVTDDSGQNHVYSNDAFRNDHTAM